MLYTVVYVTNKIEYKIRYLLLKALYKQTYGIEFNQDISSLIVMYQILFAS